MTSLHFVPHVHATTSPGDAHLVQLDHLPETQKFTTKYQLTVMYSSVFIVSDLNSSNSISVSKKTQVALCVAILSHGHNCIHRQICIYYTLHYLFIYSFTASLMTILIPQITQQQMVKQLVNNKLQRM